jgi:cob(I)alamin adenosyltransferase
VEKYEVNKELFARVRHAIENALSVYMMARDAREPNYQQKYLKAIQEELFDVAEEFDVTALTLEEIESSEKMVEGHSAFVVNFALILIRQMESRDFFPSFPRPR